MEPAHIGTGLSAEQLLAGARHAHGTLRLVGEPATGDVGRGNTQDVFSAASHCLFGFLTTREANALRRTCREACAAVTAHPWTDAQTRIAGRLARWRKCFPHAVAANVTERYDLVSADFAHLRGVRTIDMARCHNRRLGNDVAAHLRDVRVLDLSYCFFAGGMTSAILADLGGVSELTVRTGGELPYAELLQLRRRSPPLKLRLSCDDAIVFLRNSPADLEAALFVCRTMHEEAADEDEATRHYAVTATGAAAAVLGAMAAHPSSVEIKVHACAVIRYIAMYARSEAARADLLGAINVMLATLASLPHDAAIAEHVCAFLGGVALDGKDSWERVVAAGGVTAIVAACKALPRSELVAAAACTALATIAASEEGPEAVVAAGGCGVAVAALATFPLSERVASAACPALAAISANDEGCAIIAAAGGAALFVAAMTAMPRNGALVESTCRGLGKIAKNPTHHQSVTEAGGAAAIVAAGAAHIRLEEMPTTMCIALGDIACSGDAGRASVVAAGGAAAVVAAAASQRRCFDMAISAPSALADIAVGLEGCTSVVRAGGVATIMAALAAHNNDFVAPFVLSALRNVARDDEGRASVIAAGGVTSIVRAMGKFRRNGGVWMRACEALCSVAGSDDGCRSIVEAGGLDALRAAPFPGLADDALAALSARGFVA